jgi:cytochrome c5
MRHRGRLCRKSLKLRQPIPHPRQRLHFPLLQCTADPAAGQQVYRQACAFCHDKGIAGAPRVDDSMAWGLRMAQGVDALYASAIHGKGAMPARGGNPALTEADIEAAVDYMLAQSR